MTTSAFSKTAVVSTATVYVVDDDEAVRASLDWLISSVNLPVRTFASARAFLDQLADILEERTLRS